MIEEDGFRPWKGPIFPDLPVRRPFQPSVVDPVLEKAAEALAEQYLVAGPQPAGRKDDQGKLRWSLLRKSLLLPLEAVIRVLMFGAKKYGDENWQLVDNPKVRYRDALDRHLAEIDRGVLVDPDTGENHYAHVATNALFLLWFYLKGK